MFELQKLRFAVLTAFRDANIRSALMGLDVSFNECRDRTFSDHWLLHYRAHVPHLLSSAARKGLRRQFPKTRTIYRPLRISDFDGRLRGLAYSLKPNFQRRQSYTMGGKRNTRGRPIRGKDLVELALYQDSIGFSGRLLLLGVRLLARDNGNVVISRRQTSAAPVRPAGAKKANRSPRHT